MEAHLNKTNRGHRLPSSPSLLLRSHGARLQLGVAGPPMKLWEEEEETKVRTSIGEVFHL